MTVLQRTLSPAFAILGILALSACGSSDEEAAPFGVDWGQHVADAPSGENVEAEASRQPDPVVNPHVAKARRKLANSLVQIGTEFGGSMGIAVVDVETGWGTGFNENAMLPQQSVSKTWVTLTALLQASKGELDLDAPIELTRADLTLFHQPIRREILAQGVVESSAADLIERAIQQSDNTANNTLLLTVGGPHAVRTMLREQGLDGIRIGPGEIAMQSEIAGLRWRDAYSYDDAFFDARDKVPDRLRTQAFESYLSDPVDGATPAAIAEALAAIQRGDVLPRQMADEFFTIMSNTSSGPNRLKGSLAEGWVLSHKTGTGQYWDGQQSGYNDVGMLFAPDSSPYAVAVMIGRTRTSVPENMAMMQAVTRAVTRYHEALEAGAS